jgi:glycine oxidase
METVPANKERFRRAPFQHKAVMIVIVGGGICGLGIGWRLAEAGREVTVIERDEAGKAATWAAAGMLAPHVEAEHGEQALLPLALESREMWASFAGDLKRAGGIDVDYRTEGTLVVALDRDDREQLEHQREFLNGLGLGIDWLSGFEARRREPHLARAVLGAMWSPLDESVDNRLVATALRRAFTAAGGILRENTAVLSVTTSAGRASGVALADGEIAAEAVVIAAGAWSRNIDGLPDDLRPPVRPLKGQMLALQMDVKAPLIAHVVWGPGIYMVPRSDGRLVLGATVEEMGFDTTLTAGGMYDLLRRAWETLPGIYDLPLVETWAGLRPASRDDAPILGPTAMDGLVMATGHHRNGILLAPVTAKYVSRYLMTGEVADQMKPFLLSRFAGTAESGPGSAPAEGGPGFAAAAGGAS